MPTTNPCCSLIRPYLAMRAPPQKVLRNHTVLFLMPLVRRRILPIPLPRPRRPTCLHLPVGAVHPMAAPAHFFLCSIHPRWSCPHMVILPRHTRPRKYTTLRILRRHMGNNFPRRAKANINWGGIIFRTFLLALRSHMIQVRRTRVITTLATRRLATQVWILRLLQRAEARI